MPRTRKTASRAIAREPTKTAPEEAGKIAKARENDREPEPGDAKRFDPDRLV